MNKILLIAIAGSAGAVCRYGFFTITTRYLSGSIPWPTIAINSLGCFIFGLLFSLPASRTMMSGETKVIILVGFLGAFTTFSAFAFESSQFIKSSQWSLAFINIALENIGVIIAMFLGIALGKLLT